ncbi:MAG: hypothetical protein PHS24_04810 [Bacilli bacterium]|nr:hypothetical protein [Bacilli bacterium]
MKKEILQDNSSICSVCYQGLDEGDIIYIDDENDIICIECIKEYS